jgi:hypothetical protein
MQQTFASLAHGSVSKPDSSSRKIGKGFCPLNRSEDHFEMNDEIVERFSRKSLRMGTRRTVTIYLNVAGTPIFLAHPATERGKARESKSVASSRPRTPRQDHSWKSTRSARSAKTERLSDLSGNISEQLPARLHCEECVAVLQVPSYDSWDVDEPQPAPRLHLLLLYVSYTGVHWRREARSLEIEL